MIKCITFLYTILTAVKTITKPPQPITFPPSTTDDKYKEKVTEKENQKKKKEKWRYTSHISTEL